MQAGDAHVAGMAGRAEDDWNDRVCKKKKTMRQVREMADGMQK